MAESVVLNVENTPTINVTDVNVSTSVVDGSSSSGSAQDLSSALNTSNLVQNIATGIDVVQAEIILDVRDLI